MATICQPTAATDSWRLSTSIGEWQPDQRRNGADPDQQREFATVWIGPEPKDSHHLGPVVDEHGGERAEMEDGAHGKRRGLYVHAQLIEKCRDEDQVARRGDRQELGESLDQAPDDGVEHGGTVMLRAGQS